MAVAAVAVVAVAVAVVTSKHIDLNDSCVCHLNYNMYQQPYLEEGFWNLLPNQALAASPLNNVYSRTINSG